jgi:membrane associated rhomboid family serine protease
MIPFRDDIPAERTPVITYALIVINAVALFGMAQLPDLKLEEFVFRHGFVPARIAQLSSGEALEVPVEEHVEVPLAGRQVVVRQIVLPPDSAEIVSTLFTSMFMHGGLMHLVGNLWFLWLFGDNVEDRLGHATFLLFYLLGGLAAAACHWLNDPSSQVPVVGASGAIAAVLGAYVVTWPHARIKTLVILFVFVTVIEIPALIFLGGWLALQVFSALQPEELGMEQSIAWWAHIGGFVAGAILMLLLRGRDPRVRRGGFFEAPDDLDRRRLFGN